VVQCDLFKPTHIMVDKAMAVKRERISKRIGAVTPEEMARVDMALRTWLELDAGS
jgi:mRNA-degrading endonuclease toxin of MazEF toxin-antitoxin module